MLRVLLFPTVLAQYSLGGFGIQQSEIEVCAVVPRTAYWITGCAVFTIRSAVTDGSKIHRIKLPRTFVSLVLQLCI